MSRQGPRDQEFTNGAGHVADRGLQGSTAAQKYSGGTTATGVAISSGVSSLDIDNYHATQHVWINFGTSSASAVTAVGTSGSETGVMIRAGTTKRVAVPSAATHFAYICSGASTTFNVNQV